MSKFPLAATIAVALRINDACIYLGISRSKMYQLIKAGKLTSYKPAGRVTLLRADLDDFARGSPKAEK